MSTGIDLGEIGDLAKAIGLTDESGSIRSDWLSNPGNYLSSVLADDTQRNALIDFVDQILAIDREARRGWSHLAPDRRKSGPPCHCLRGDRSHSV